MQEFSKLDEKVQDGRERENLGRGKGDGEENEESGADQ